MKPDRQVHIPGANHSLLPCAAWFVPLQPPLQPDPRTSSMLSHWSMKPDRQVYIPGANFLLLPRSARCPSGDSTSTMTCVKRGRVGALRNEACAHLANTTSTMTCVKGRVTGINSTNRSGKHHKHDDLRRG